METAACTEEKAWPSSLHNSRSAIKTVRREEIHKFDAKENQFHEVHTYRSPWHSPCRCGIKTSLQTSDPPMPPDPLPWRLSSDSFPVQNPLRSLCNIQRLGHFVLNSLLIDFHPKKREVFVVPIRRAFARSTANSSRVFCAGQRERRECRSVNTLLRGSHISLSPSSERAQRRR